MIVTSFWVHLQLDDPLKEIQKMMIIFKKKSGYKLKIKHKSLMIFLYVWLHNENHIYEFGDFYFFLSFLATKNLQFFFF
jgi:hypothetical protein